MLDSHKDVDTPNVLSDYLYNELFCTGRAFEVKAENKQKNRYVVIMNEKNYVVVWHRSKGEVRVAPRMELEKKLKAGDVFLFPELDFGIEQLYRQGTDVSRVADDVREKMMRNYEEVKWDDG